MDYQEILFNLLLNTRDVGLESGFEMFSGLTWTCLLALVLVPLRLGYLSG